ncbi:nitroreductase family protein [Roseivirga echinicomitans]|uniref:Putative NAD(P)H nitroreductase n=1 Tax=Roseivirga echinicomitans TaxID=296218 RepID=A0A150XXQ8_9BACT|nr:nitroreductase [Roseivirga echinicomitans]KYG83560.1 nitroreductase [Roseivirga echinicomitans]
MKFSIEETNKLLRNRRSIYPAMYSEVPVDDAIIKEMLENANWAPTHKLTEPWRFVVFKGEGLKKLATFQSELYKELATKASNFDASKFEKLATKPLLASHIIAIGMKREPNVLVPEIEEISAVACAVQNMYLTATAHGIGCYWGSGGITYKEEAKSFFGLGAEDKLLGFLYVGNLKTDKWPAGKRGPIEEKVSWVES